MSVRASETQVCSLLSRRGAPVVHETRQLTKISSAAIKKGTRVQGWGCAGGAGKNEGKAAAERRRCGWCATGRRVWTGTKTRGGEETRKRKKGSLVSPPPPPPC